MNSTQICDVNLRKRQVINSGVGQFYLLVYTQLILNRVENPEMEKSKFVLWLLYQNKAIKRITEDVNEENVVQNHDNVEQADVNVNNVL